MLYPKRTMDPEDFGLSLVDFTTVWTLATALAPTQIWPTTSRLYPTADASADATALCPKVGIILSLRFHSKSFDTLLITMCLVDLGLLYVETKKWPVKCALQLGRQHACLVHPR